MTCWKEIYFLPCSPCLPAKVHPRAGFFVPFHYVFLHPHCGIQGRSHDPPPTHPHRRLSSDNISYHRLQKHGNSHDTDSFLPVPFQGSSMKKPAAAFPYLPHRQSLLYKTPYFLHMKALLKKQSRTSGWSHLPGASFHFLYQDHKSIQNYNQCSMRGSVPPAAALSSFPEASDLSSPKENVDKKVLRFLLKA